MPCCGAIWLSSKAPQLFCQSLPLETKKGNVPGVFPLSWDAPGHVYVVVPEALVPLCSTCVAPC